MLGVGMTSMPPTPGIIRGHRWDCPHGIWKGAKTPELLAGTKWSSLHTNSLYRSMKHSITHALSWDQVCEYIIEPYARLQAPEACRVPPRSARYPGAYINKLRNKMSQFQGRDPLYTLQYMWTYARSGIFVAIRDSRVQLFVPFCNPNYVNSWTSEARNVLPKKDLPPDRWWCNGWMLCEKCPTNFVGDTWLTTVANMLDSACKQGMYDMDMIINKRDTPCVRIDGIDPMNPMDINLPRVADCRRMIPVFSFFTGAAYADVAMPHPVDWQRLTGRVYAQANPQALVKERPDVYWAHKDPKAVFRGSMTGIGTDSTTNQRAYLCSLQSAKLDAALTGGNVRFKVHPATRAVQVSTWRASARHFIPMEDQQDDYRWGICIDGHSAADRMGRLFSGRQAVLKIAAPRFALAECAWISDFLHAWEHFVPVKHDLTDLMDGISWLDAHDNEALAMADRCRAMSEQFVQLESVLEWWRIVSSM